jgi:hypothetical protein
MVMGRLRQVLYLSKVGTPPHMHVEVRIFLHMNFPTFESCPQGHFWLELIKCMIYLPALPTTTDKFYRKTVAAIHGNKLISAWHGLEYGWNNRVNCRSHVDRR